MEQRCPWGFRTVLDHLCRLWQSRCIRSVPNLLPMSSCTSSNPFRPSFHNQLKRFRGPNLFRTFLRTLPCCKIGTEEYRLRRQLKPVGCKQLTSGQRSYWLQLKRSLWCWKISWLACMHTFRLFQCKDKHFQGQYRCQWHTKGQHPFHLHCILHFHKVHQRSQRVVGVRRHQSFLIGWREFLQGLQWQRMPSKIHSYLGFWREQQPYQPNRRCLANRSWCRAWCCICW